MLNGFAGLLGGFNGKFEFESGAQYPSEVKYGVMRFFNAIYGAMVRNVNLETSHLLIIIGSGDSTGILDWHSSSLLSHGCCSLGCHDYYRYSGGEKVEF